MKFTHGIDSNQAALFPVSLEQSIDKDNEARLMDLFVDSPALKDYGFKLAFVENGRPAYHPADLLKLYVYGYLNKTRSSRDLEKECKRNIEAMWLLKTLRPGHNTISHFRRDNPIAIKKVFRATVQIAKHFEPIGGKLIAGDSKTMGNMLQRAGTDVGFMFIAYNLRRIINLLGMDALKKHLKQAAFSIFEKTGINRTISAYVRQRIFSKNIFTETFSLRYKGLYLVIIDENQ